MKRIVLFTAILLSATISAAQAEMPLDLIAIFHSDSSSGAMWTGYASPGDIDGDGYSEVFAKEVSGARRLLVFSGGDPPDTIPDMVFTNSGGGATWVEDLNGDGLEDFVIKRKTESQTEGVEVWFGATDFLLKTEPDLVFHHQKDTVSGFGSTMSAGDLNGDNKCDLVISAVNGEMLPFDGRMYIYYGGDLLDTIPDESVTIYDQGIAYDDFVKGTAVGDINGDGFADLCYSGQPLSYDPGYVAIIFGNHPIDTLPNMVIWSPWGVSFGSQTFGDNIIPLGDMDRDGFDDFAVAGSAVWPCIFYGGDPFVPDPVILGDTTDPNTAGDRISNIGDINHDGWDDIGVGFPGYNLESGLFFIYFGYQPMNTEADIVFLGSQAYPYAGMQFGNFVVPAGDFNGDGIDDVLVTSRQWFGSAHDRGNVYVFAGSSELPTSADEVGDETRLPKSYNILEQNHPNPFNGVTTIRYTLRGHSAQDIELSIFDILGHKVRTLKQCRESGGVHTAEWDGTDDNSEPVSSGVYFYRLKSDDESLSKKMLLIK